MKVPTVSLSHLWLENESCPQSCPMTNIDVKNVPCIPQYSNRDAYHNAELKTQKQQLSFLVQKCFLEEIDRLLLAFVNKRYEYLLNFSFLF